MELTASDSEHSVCLRLVLEPPEVMAMMAFGERKEKTSANHIDIITHTQLEFL